MFLSSDKAMTRVTIVQEWQDADTGDYRSSTMLELAAPAAMLARFAPEQVLAALYALAGTEPEAVPAAVADEVDVPAVNPPGHYRAAEQGDAALVHVPDAEPTGEIKPKRKRRTKAEIEADRQREASGQAAPTGEGPTGDGDADLAVYGTAAAPEPAAYTTPDGPVVAEAPAPVPASEPATAPPAAAPAVPAGPDGAPWNPFKQ
jgi:ribonuclease E